MELVEVYPSHFYTHVDIKIINQTQEKDPISSFQSKAPYTGENYHLQL